MTTTVNRNAPAVRTDLGATSTTGTTGGTPTPAADAAATAATTASAASGEVRPDSHTDGVERTNRPGLVERTYNRAVDKVKVMTLDEIRKEHSLGTDIGPVGIKLSEDIVNPDQLTAVQKQTSEKIKAETGKNVVWLKTQVALHAGSGVSQSLPGLPASAGFSADGYLVYETTQPHAVDTDGFRKLMLDGAKVTGEVLKDHSVDLPYKAEDAFAMPPGSS